MVDELVQEYVPFSELAKSSFCPTTTSDYEPVQNTRLRNQILENLPDDEFGRHLTPLNFQPTLPSS